MKTVHIMMIGHGFVLTQGQMIGQILRIMSIHVTVGRVGITSHAKRRFEELDTRHVGK